MLVGMAGCDGGKAAVPAVSPAVEVPSVTGPQSPPGPTSTQEEAPLSVVVGRVQLTKGEQPMVDGRLVSAESFEKRFGADWRKELREHRVRITGRAHTHVCGPDEQCLSGGEIPQMLDVRMIEICASPDHYFTRGRNPVPCPPTKAEESACQTKCNEESKACGEASARGTGPGLRPCGCAMVTCEQGCEMSGEPDFHCH